MTKLTNDTFNDAISSDISVIKFGATWCSPCKMVDRILLSASQKMENIPFYSVDVDECPDKAQQLNIISVPTIFVFKGGVIVDTMTGVVSESAIIETITKHI